MGARRTRSDGGDLQAPTRLSAPEQTLHPAGAVVARRSRSGQTESRYGEDAIILRHGYPHDQPGRLQQSEGTPTCSFLRSGSPPSTLIDGSDHVVATGPRQCSEAPERRIQGKCSGTLQGRCGIATCAAKCQPAPSRLYIRRAFTLPVDSTLVLVVNCTVSTAVSQASSCPISMD
jgi:hypothetical protein